MKLQKAFGRVLYPTVGFHFPHPFCLFATGTLNVCAHAYGERLCLQCLFSIFRLYYIAKRALFMRVFALIT